jgi:hypothetical protein
MKKYLYIAAVVFPLIFVLTGCENEDKDPVKDANITVLGTIQASNKRHLEVKDDESRQLEAFVMPQSNKSKVKYALTGTTSGAIEITPDGLITPLVKTPETGPIPNPLGIDTIIVSLENDPKVYVKYPVKVISHIVLVESITIKSEGQNAKVEMGKTFDLGKQITINPSGATEKKVVYSSSDESIAKIDENGIVTPVKSGQVILTVKATDRTAVFTSTTLTVVEKISGPIDIDRSAWKILKTSHNRPEDAAIVNDLSSIIDGNASTCLSLVKPGKSYGGITVGADEQVYFILDMGVETEFEYFRILHRNNNNKNLRVWAVTLYGSNNGTDFTPITKSLDIPNVDDNSSKDSGNVKVPKSKYRYIKMTYDKWVTATSASMQIAEFYLGNIIE